MKTLLQQIKNIGFEYCIIKTQGRHLRAFLLNISLKINFVILCTSLSWHTYSFLCSQCGSTIWFIFDNDYRYYNILSKYHINFIPSVSFKLPYRCKTTAQTKLIKLPQHVQHIIKLSHVAKYFKRTSFQHTPVKMEKS